MAELAQASAVMTVMAVALKTVSFIPIISIVSSCCATLELHFGEVESQMRGLENRLGRMRAPKKLRKEPKVPFRINNISTV